MTQPGALKLSRKMWREVAKGGCPLWNEPREFSRWEAWVDLIQMAAFSDHERMIGDELLRIERGEVVASLRFLGARWRWSTSKVRRFLRALENMDRITTRTRHSNRHGNRHSYLLVNYDTYQGGRHKDDTKTTQIESTHTRAGARAREDEPSQERLPGIEVPTARKTARDPQWALDLEVNGYRRSDVVQAVLRIINSVTGREADPQHCATAAEPVVRLWKKLECPPPGDFAEQACLVAHAARKCPDPIFARDVRAEGWDSGVDRSRSITTLMVQSRWDERLQAAQEWDRQRSDYEEFNDPHSPARHGVTNALGFKWDSRSGGWVKPDEWKPWEEG